MLTPFALDRGQTLLVDRGVVPERLRDPKTRPTGQLNGIRHIVGVWRIPDSPGLFTPGPNLAKRIWYARDVRGISRADHIRLAAPVVIEADAAPNPGGWPKGGQTVSFFGMSICNMRSPGSASPLSCWEAGLPFTFHAAASAPAEECTSGLTSRLRKLLAEFRDKTTQAALRNPRHCFVDRTPASLP